MAYRTGTSEEEARQAYAMLIVTENMARELAKDAGEMDRIKSKVKYGLNKILGNRGFAYLSASAAGGAIGGTGTAIGMAIGSVLFPGVGTVVGGMLGFAVASALSFGTGCAIGYASLKAKERIEVSDKEFKRNIDGSIDMSAAHLRLERAINYASLLRQMMHFMNQEAQKVMDSNVFATAVDCRNFIDTSALKGSKDCQSAVDLMATPNQGAWCDFKYIPELENAPRAKDYRTKDGRRIEYLIDIFKAACAGGDKVNFDELKRYADGTKLPIGYRTVCTNPTELIKKSIKNNIPHESIVAMIECMDASLSREEILKIIEEESMALQTQSK